MPGSQTLLETSLPVLGRGDGRTPFRRWRRTRPSGVKPDSPPNHYAITTKERESVTPARYVAKMGKERHVLPPDLEKIPPGMFLAAIVDSVDRDRLEGHDVVRLLRARERLVAHLQAQSLADTAAVARCASADGLDRLEESAEFASTEISSALSLTRRAAESRLDLAERLRGRLPAVWRLLHDGSIDLPRARALVYSTDHLSSDDARQAVERVLSDASRLTTGQLRARIQRICLEIDSESARRRMERTIEDRRIFIEMTPYGSVNILGLDLHPKQATSASNRVDSLAQQIKRSGDSRTIDQIRADVFLDLLNGESPETPNGRGITDMVCDLETLAELADRSAELPGVGPIATDVARQVFAETPHNEHRFTVMDDAGQVVTSGITRRRPTARQRRRIESRNRACVFVGCRRPAIKCDIDHRVAYSEGGPTTDCNLAPLCRFHHRAKHEAPWQMKSFDLGFQWTSPLGHTYVTSGRSP